MKHVHIWIRIILLMGLCSYGIAINFGLHQFWACKCPPGFYAQGTSKVYASAELCKDKNESFIVGPDDFTTPSHDTNNGVATILEACSRCAHGCASCKGPEVDECLECVADYFAYQTLPEKSGVRSEKTKRSSEARLNSGQMLKNGRQSVTSQKFFEEDELLIMNGGMRSARDAIQVKPSSVYPQNSQNLNDDGIFNDFKDYDDDRESSGEIDDERQATVAHISKQVDIPQIFNDDPKFPRTLDYKPTDSAIEPENKSEDTVDEPKNQDSAETDEEESYESANSSFRPMSSGSIDINSQDYAPKDTTENEFKNVNSTPIIEPPSEENLNSDNSKIESQKVVVEEDNINIIPELSTDENSDEDLETNQDILDTFYNDAESADEPEEHIEINNASSNVAAPMHQNLNSENMDEKSGISGNALLTNTDAPESQDPDKVNEAVGTSATRITIGSALISTATYSCLVNCPEGHYNTSNRLCLICHAECEGCFNEGPTNCIKCRNYKKDLACVASCTSNATSTEKYNSNCELQIEDETIPAGYYAIPPLVILLVCACIGMSYCRKQRRLKNSLPGRPEGMHKADMNSSEISFTRTHLDNKKCFCKGTKHPSHIALTEFKNSSETSVRKGNPYVYAERPLLPKYAHQTATQSPAWSACKDMSEPEDDFDPLYETPDNTMDVETLKRYHYRRRSSPSHVHFALTTSKVKEISNSLEDCTDTDSLRLEDGREYDDVDDLSTENYENQFGVGNGEQLLDMEAPYYQAPPLPVRNSPSVQDIINDDPIYVNIDENV